ncbi:hypothetical protein ACTL6P_09690 [Endozoicomonas acroporae]|uniref:hypothetical protein n=1 Tax=Endozoicomonas acroporae TaxID=1701104 RepID=UPI0011AF6584|nr:hypothetical protein [Endozoicomonas acroporae]
MNIFNTDPNNISGLSYFQELPVNYLPTTAAPDSHLNWHGHFLQTPSPYQSGELNPQFTNQGIPCSARALDDFSISILPLTGNTLRLSGFYSQDNLDTYPPCQFSDNHFFSTNSTTTGFQQLPPAYSSVTFPQPSLHPAAIVGALDKSTDQQVLTETMQYNATLSSGSGEPIRPTPEDTYAYGINKPRRTKLSFQASQARYAASAKGRACQARYTASVKGKASRARYLATDKGKICMAKASAKYKKSDKGQAANARARAKYEKSAKGRETRARYAASDRYRMKNAIKCAKYRAYHSAIKQGMSEALARKMAELVANEKLAELSMTSPPLSVSQNAIGISAFLLN